MIIFDLACQHGHRFEGWFQSREDFDSQLAASLVTCPQCGSPEIRRVPSAVHLARPGPVSASAVEVPIPDVRGSAFAVFRQLTEMLLANCEDVGARFAEEARKIHYVEAPERSIRGEASTAEYEALREEGIEVFRWPYMKPGDLH
ncbi:DUF1178 family protein [Accumulibacter sp.]|jgi:hypothetical protein|uniref:DUF1178 family protein n=1 Tax=Accumulibacter sp. TaxID=2053492 RepID=UPI002C6962EA|nr:DUF1178 family protein [Accumulibacter sp.]HPU81420.1 DUF1178 family protein [Accumulibacter sp.]